MARGTYISSLVVATGGNRCWAAHAVAICFSRPWSRFAGVIGFMIVGYVVMPEHIHLLVSEPEEKNPSTVMQALKLGFARRILAREKRKRQPSQGRLFGDAARHIWQKRFYDFNVWTERKRIEKLRYMHRNPVKRGLVASPELWKWSSFRAYSLGEAGSVKVNAWEVLKMKIRPPAA